MSHVEVTSGDTTYIVPISDISLSADHDFYYAYIDCSSERRIGITKSEYMRIKNLLILV